MKQHGAPQLKPHTKPTADEWAALKKAFAACRDQLPAKTAKGHSDRQRHRFTRPTAAQVAAFKACMADKGFPIAPAAGQQRPDLRDPNVRKALWAAMKACLPLLKPAPGN